MQDAANAVLGWTSIEVTAAPADAGLGDVVGGGTSAPAAATRGLAATGAEALPGILLAILVLGAGAALVTIQRRRASGRG